MPIMVRGLADGVSEEDLRDLFSQHGTVNEVKINDRENSAETRFAIVKMADRFVELGAIEKVTGSVLHGMQINVVEARTRVPGIER
jgi:RNA recognition motif-containing protein